MADNYSHPWTLLFFFVFFFFSSLQIPLCFSSPQNIEVYFPPPVKTRPPPPQPPPPNNPPPEISPPPPIISPESPPPPSTSGKKIATAVAVTAASTLVVAALAFLLVNRLVVAKRKREKVGSVPAAAPAVNGGGGGGASSVSASAVAPMAAQSRSTYVRYQGEVKGFVVDENGLDVLYWRKLEKKNSKGLKKEVLRKNESIQEIPLLRDKSSTSHLNVINDDDNNNINIRINNNYSNSITRKPPAVEPELLLSRSSTSSSSASGPPPVSAPPTPPPPAIPFLSVPKKLNPPVPPPPMKNSNNLSAAAAPVPPPPPPPAVPVPPPPPVPIRGNKAPLAPPPPAPKARSLNAVGVGSGKPPAGPRGKAAAAEDGGAGGSQVKMKALHWDKVNMGNAEHSMVWDKINKDSGSFRFDGDLMEALFGYVAKKPQKDENTPNSAAEPPPNATSSSTPSQQKVFILDTRKSQNIAIVLKSLYVSRKEIVDALMEGIGLSQETLEKLSRVAPTREEQTQILEYSGDPARLADAESFLFHVLRPVPSAFARLEAMLFRSNYGSEISHLKDSVKTLEKACDELRARGLFVKLLEAVLKAGNRMNAGTSRGDAQAFNLSSLRKLSDVRSTDGKTTLLHFVVEEVVRSEGKRCVLNRERSLTRSSSAVNPPLTAAAAGDENEHIMLGLPIVGGLSSEFASVKKAAASIDHESFASLCSVLARRASEIRRTIVAQSVKGGFAREMEAFLGSVDEELERVGEEKDRVLGLVAKTTEYYQAGASNDRDSHPFQLFVIVKDFLAMVDQVCVEIARNMQKNKRVGNNINSNGNLGSRPEKKSVKFPILPENFMSDKRRSSDSDDE